MKTPSVWELDLFVVDDTPKAKLAYTNLKHLLCAAHKPCKIHVVDLLKEPEAAAQNQIMANPTIIRTSPLPRIKLVGTLTDRKLARAKLGLA